MRYYYDCPIKAAYMAKYFGISFDGQSFEYIATAYCDYRAEWFKEANPEKYYLTDDSLHLLEPQVGDMVFYPYNDAAVILGEFFPVPKVGTKLKIIQRNGIPFMWPETENPMPKEGV